MLLLQNCKLTPIYWLVMLVDHQKDFLTLSPGSSVMLVPMPLVMRGVPAQIFFAVPENKTYK